VSGTLPPPLTGPGEPAPQGYGPAGDGAGAPAVVAVPVPQDRRDRDAGEVPGTTSSLRLALATFAENKPAVASLFVLVLIVAFCFVGPLIYHTNQTAANLIDASRPPSARFPLGTDPIGRDELGSLMVGGQSTLEVGFAVAVLATAFGLMWGLVAGYFGGIIDAVLMRIVDALLAIPFLFFVVLLASLVIPNLFLIILVITAVSWLSTARLVRGEALSLRTREYVRAAEGFGAKTPRILFRHITPNLLGVVIVNGTLKVADAILIFASIGYLGLSVPPPATSWGVILAAGINDLFDGYWWQLWPAGFLIVITVLAFTVLGEGLRDVVERRLQKR
jgi:ABC-type dipeptide/oligopeptide/nickel transport system permease subunit